ncbi:MAG TPA: nitrous oxide reductase family maturation protein NosD [Polyangia bacterium]|jgi:nitrous oxidase accessory protein
MLSALVAIALFRTILVGCAPGDPPLAPALSTARPGDTIEVCGRQLGAIAIPAGVTVRGRAGSGAILDGDGAPVVVDLAGGARLSSIAVRGDGGRLDRDDAAVRLRGVGAEVAGVRVESSAFGIYLAGAIRARVSDCEVAGAPGLPSAARGNGIHLWNSRHSRIERCRVHDTRDGIYLSFAHDNLIADNDVSRVRFGIHYMYSDNNQVIGNRLRENTVGAALMFSKNNRFQRNRCDHNLRYGMLFKDVDSSEITGNQLGDNGEGLSMQQSYGNRVSGNRIADNTVGIQMSAASSDNLVVGNLFANNAQQVLMHGARDNRWDDGRAGNFWSDYTGVDENGDGIGDTEYRAGDLAGYLADAYPLVRVLEAGPAYDAIRFAESAFPVIDYPGVVDHRPLAAPPREFP